MSNIKRFIPESVKQTWHEWRAAMKKEEHALAGNNEVSDHVEMAGWGVEEAEKANKSEASKHPPVSLPSDFSPHPQPFSDDWDFDMEYVIDAKI